MNSLFSHPAAFIVCGLIAVLVPVFVFLFALSRYKASKAEDDNSFSIKNSIWVVSAVSLVFASYVLIIPPTLSTSAWHEALLGNVYQTMKIILFGSPMESLVEMVHTTLGNSTLAIAYSLLIELYSFLVPFAISVTALGVFVSHLSYWKIKLASMYKEELYIFSTLNEKSELLATDIVRNVDASKSLIVFANMSKQERDKHNTLIERMKNIEQISSVYTPTAVLGVPVNWKKVKSAHYFFFDDDSKTNVGDTIAAIKAAHAKLEPIASGMVPVIITAQQLQENPSFKDAVCALGQKCHIYCLRNGREDEILISSARTSAARLDEAADTRTAFVRNTLKDSLDIRLISEVEDRVRSAFEITPITSVLDASKVNLSSYDGKGLALNQTLVVVVFGLGLIGRRLVRTAYWMGRIPGVKLRIVGVDLRVDNVKRDFEYRYPNMMKDKVGGEPTISFHAFDVFSKSTEDLFSNPEIVPPGSALHVFVALGMDTANLNAALRIRRCLELMRARTKDEAQRKMLNCPVSFCIEQNEISAITQVLKAGGDAFSLTPFGSVKQVYSYENIVESKNEKLAKQIAAAYEKISGYKATRTAAICGFSADEISKESNRALAAFAPTVMWLMGMQVVDADSAEARGEIVDEAAWLEALGITVENREKLYNNKEFDGMEAYLADGAKNPVMWHLAESEHKRWQAFYEQKGWVGINMDELVSCHETGAIKRKDRQKSDKLKVHLCICPMDELIQREAQFNQYMAEQGMPEKKKDFVRYDRALLMELRNCLTGDIIDGQPFCMQSVVRK